jgi:p-aminobenzoyl-glutamate transporter AbgT
MKSINKKAQMGNLQSFIIGIAGVAIVLVVVLIVLGNLRDTTTANTAEYNASATMISKLSTVPTWVGIIIVVALAFIVLGFFYGRSQGMY